MSAEMEYFIYLLEYYAEYTKKSARDVLMEWDGKGITDTIFNGYFRYHQERKRTLLKVLTAFLRQRSTRHDRQEATHRGCSHRPYSLSTPAQTFPPAFRLSGKKGNLTQTS